MPYWILSAILFDFILDSLSPAVILIVVLDSLSYIGYHIGLSQLYCMSYWTLSAILDFILDCLSNIEFHIGLSHSYWLSYLMSQQYWISYWTLLAILHLKLHTHKLHKSNSSKTNTWSAKKMQLKFGRTVQKYHNFICLHQ